MPIFCSVSQIRLGLIATILLISVANHVAAKKIDGDQLLAPDHLVKVQIQVAESDWKKLCQQSRNMGAIFSGVPTERPYTYFKADVTIDGVEIPSVGIRKKGFLGSADEQRPSLKIKFDEFKKQSPVKGLTRITLNNNKQDRSQASQSLAYKIYREAGIAAPRCNLAVVTVNGEPLGVYSHVESIKKPFLDHAFGDKSGNLYEGTLADFYPKAIVGFQVKTNEDTNDLSDLNRLADVIAKEGDLDLEELDKIVNLDLFFRYWALDGMFGFWDGYAANQNNYYVYFNPKDNGRAHFIPWGADWLFTNSSPFSRGDTSPKVIYAQSMLANRLIRTKGVVERYQATMKRLLDEVWDEDKMIAEIDRIEKLIDGNLHSSQSSAANQMDEIRDFIRNRRSDMERELKRWEPSIPELPRKPTYVVDAGSAAGAFTTSFDKQTEMSKWSITLGKKQIELENATVRASDFQMPTWGRSRSNRQETQQAPPVQIEMTADQPDGEPITISLYIDRKKFAAQSPNTIQVTGRYREGNSRGGFGGFGRGGPRRSVTGELKLTESGVESGAVITGSLSLKIVETHGGFFSQRGR